MTEFERLKCLIDESMRLQEEKCCRCSIGDIAQFLIDNGVIAPPVEVGDKFYYLRPLYDRGIVAEAECRGYYSGNRYCQYLLDNDCHIYPINLIFLTKEEAEAALKECEQNANN